MYDGSPDINTWIAFIFIVIESFSFYFGYKYFLDSNRLKPDDKVTPLRIKQLPTYSSGY